MGRQGRRRRPHRQPDVPPALSIGGDQVEQGPDGYDYRVRRISGARAIKIYRCPGCDHEIAVGVAHVVVWPADASGDGVDDRRHWHSSCWTNRGNRGPTRKWS
ncbi:MAG: hypothetical protein ACRDUS_08805 [Mycobacterium sp.]